MGETTDFTTVRGRQNNAGEGVAHETAAQPRQLAASRDSELAPLLRAHHDRIIAEVKLIIAESNRAILAEIREVAREREAEGSIGDANKIL